MEFILNDTYGINGIENIDLREIIEIFGEPDEREIIRDSKDKDFKVNFMYSEPELEIFYRINHFFESDEVEWHSLSFIVKELYLNNELKIKNGEEMWKVLDKIELYHDKINKPFEFEHEEDEYSGSYEFTNLEMTVYFEIENGMKYLDDIYVDLPYEDDPEVLSFEEILYMK